MIVELDTHQLLYSWLSRRKALHIAVGAAPIPCNIWLIGAFATLTAKIL